MTLLVTLLQIWQGLHIGNTAHYENVVSKLIFKITFLGPLFPKSFQCRLSYTFLFLPHPPPPSHLTVQISVLVTHGFFYTSLPILCLWKYCLENKFSAPQTLWNPFISSKRKAHLRLQSRQIPTYLSSLGLFWMCIDSHYQLRNALQLLTIEYHQSSCVSVELSCNWIVRWEFCLSELSMLICICCFTTPFYYFLVLPHMITCLGFTFISKQSKVMSSSTQRLHCMMEVSSKYFLTSQKNSNCTQQRWRHFVDPHQWRPPWE